MSDIPRDEWCWYLIVDQEGNMVDYYHADFAAEAALETLGGEYPGEFEVIKVKESD